MDPLTAVVGLVLALVALELGFLAGLERGRRDPGTPEVIRSMPLTFKARPAPWESSTTGGTHA